LDWEKRRRVTRDGRRADKFDPSAKEAFEALSFFLDNPEVKGAGNFVVIPGKWKTMSEADAHARRIFHRKRACAEHPTHSKRSDGDRWIRVRNETLETFGLVGCGICSEHIRF
jgi:hypothetical protein